MALTFLEMQDQIKAGLGGRSDKDALIKQGLNLSQTRIARAFEYKEMIQAPTSVDLSVYVATISNTTAAAPGVSDDSDAGYAVGDFWEDNTASPSTFYQATSVAVGAATWTALSYQLTTDPTTAQTISLPATFDKLYSTSLINGTFYFKLRGIPLQQWEKYVPSDAAFRTGKPFQYTLRNDSIVLYPVPTSAYTLKYIASLKPAELVLDADTSDLKDKDDMLISLTLSWMYNLLGEREKANFNYQIFKQLETDAIKADNREPDTHISSSSSPSEFQDDYWRTPFKY
jgi:hypothetical protein